MSEVFSCGGCGIDPGEGPIDPEHLRKIQKHPCFNREAAHTFGRIHLPVAPECNVQCNFCVREFDCVNESRPGVTSQVLPPAEALERVREVVSEFDNIRTVGIAGPGEPLANEATFETFRLIRDAFPDLHLCVSSNGLLLPDKIDLLHELGVDTITVTMSAVDPKIGKEIYSWVFYGGKYYRDLEGAEFLLSKQLAGIKAAVERGMLVKINSVMIPTVNDHHMVEIAKKAKELGAFMQNIMPLIPQYKFAHLKPPTAVERKAAQDTAAEFVRQMRHCRQCRADAVGLLGQDLSKELFAPAKIEAAKREGPAFRVAVTSSTKDGMVDLQFAHTKRFLIYEMKGNTVQLVEARNLVVRNGQSATSEAANLLKDCKYILTRRVGVQASQELKKAGIEAVEDYENIQNAIKKLIDRASAGQEKISGGGR